MTLARRLDYAGLVPAAAKGDLAALRKLASVAYDEAAQVEGAHDLEALTAAEVWGRFAAALGDADDARRLCAILAHRAASDADVGRDRRAAIYEADVLALADGGSAPQHADFDRLVAAALSGDADAHEALFEHLVGAIDAADCDYGEGLVGLEIVARIAEAWGSARFRSVLAGVLCWQIEFDLSAGRWVDASERGAELADRMAAMTASDDPGLVAISRTVLPLLPESLSATMKAAALRNPALLEFLPNRGSC